MVNSRALWISQMCVLLALYAGAGVLAAMGHGFEHVLVRLAVIVLAVHVLEVPVAFYMLRGRQAKAGRVVGATLLFGLVWWLPARRGLFAVA